MPMLNKVLHLRIAVICHDSFMVWLAWILGFLIRYSIWPESPAIEYWSIEILCVIFIQALVSFWFNMYRGLWRFASMPDLVNLVKSATVGTLIIGCRTPGSPLPPVQRPVPRAVAPGS